MKNIVKRKSARVVDNLSPVLHHCSGKGKQQILKYLSFSVYFVSDTFPRGGIYTAMIMSYVSHNWWGIRVFTDLPDRNILIYLQQLRVRLAVIKAPLGTLTWKLSKIV